MQPTALTNWIGRHRVDVAVAAIVLGTFFPVLGTRYGYSDDYMLLYDFQRNARAAADVELANGRPGMLALHFLGSLVVDDISGLRWFRLLGVVGLAALAVAVSRLARASGRSVAVAAVLGLAVAALPSGQIMAAWSILWVGPIAALLGVGAAVAAERGRLVPGVLALACAVLIYQPAAMCYAVPLAIWSTGPLEWKPARTSVRRHTIILGAGGLVAVIAWFLGRGLGDPAAGRNHLSSDPLGELMWFLGQVLPRAVALNPARLQPLVSAVVIVLLVIGLVIAERRNRRRLLFLTGLVMLSYAPSFAVQGDWPTARSMAALTPVLAVLAVRACEGWAQPLPARWRVLAGPLAFTVGVLLCLSAAWTVTQYFARPQHRELELVQAAVADADLRPGAHVKVRGGAWFHHIAPSTSLDEFGNLSIKSPWVPSPLVNLLRYQDTGSWAGSSRLVDESGDDVLDLDAAVRPASRRP